MSHVSKIFLTYDLPFYFWLILSGIYKPYLVISGAIISVLITVFMLRAEIIDHESHPINHFFKLYFFIGLGY